jgi:hypothetical protein
MSSKNKNPLQYTDGKTVKDSDTEEIRDLEDLLRGQISNPFKIKTREEFDRKIAAMNLIDMQGMAVAVGIFPSGNKTTLRKKLKKEFTRYDVGGKGRVFTSTKPLMDPGSMTEDQKKLFNIV